VHPAWGCDPRDFRGLFRVRGAASRCSNDVVDQVLDGSGSFAFPAPRSYLSVARSYLRGFPSIHRLLLASSRSRAAARPSWASLLSRTEDISAFLFHRPRSVVSDRLSWDSSGLPPFPFHRRHPRCSPSRARPPFRAAEASDSMAFRIAFRPRRFARPRRFSPPIARAFTRLSVTVQDDEGLASLLHLAADRRVRCVSAAPSRGASPGSRSFRSPTTSGNLNAVPCWSQRLRFPAAKFVPPGGFSPPAARCVATPGVASPRSLPPRTLRVSRSATVASSPLPVSPLLPYREDVVPRGLAPLAGLYQHTPYSGVCWPTLPGPCSPSRSPSWTAPFGEAWRR
jgi:hypothetical protein